MQPPSWLVMRWRFVRAVLCLLAACTPSIDDEVEKGVRLPERRSASSDSDAEAPANGTDIPTNGGGQVPTNGGGPSGQPDAASPPPPPPPPPCGELKPNELLAKDQSRSSCDKRFTLVMQTDGNLVLYKNGVGALWHTNTHGTSGERASMQGDGNFVLYDAANTPLFHTNTHSHPGAFLAIQDDGNLVIYENGAPLWASNTAGN